MRSTELLFFIVIWLAFIKIISLKYNIAISSTPSLPYALFILDKKYDFKEIKKDAIIAFKYPGKNKYVYNHNDLFIKIIKCVPGDYLRVFDKKYYCNKKYIATALDKDSQGKKIDNFKFNGIIPKGKYFVIGTHPRSFDSRYWGFVDKNKIIAIAKGLI